MRCQSNAVDDRMVIRPDYFHIGVGECPTDTYWLFAGVKIYIGLKQLFSNADTITDFGLIVILLGKTDADRVFVVNGRNYSITKIIKHVKYILVCKKCNHTLPNYLKVISGLTACDYDLAEIIALKLGYVNKEHDAIKNGCSLSEYTLVADYDTLRERALGIKISIDRISEFVQV